MERHDIADAPKIFHIDSRGAPADGFDESAPHDLDVAADQRLQIGGAGIEQDQQYVEPLILEKTLGFRGINREKGDVHGRQANNNFRRALPRQSADQTQRQENQESNAFHHCALLPRFSRRGGFEPAPTKRNSNTYH